MKKVTNIRICLKVAYRINVMMNKRVRAYFATRNDQNIQLKPTKTNSWHILNIELTIVTHFCFIVWE